mmetsp:Transcript_7312/g.32961  ORF Transcript_7312/g.32961 Transcript_7312/m.32961 type:complete len:1239 (+) Transcript_7312:238-3954(+)
MARRRVWTAWMIALVAFLTLLGSARALHNTPAPTPAPSSTDHHHDDDHHVEIAPDDVYPARTRYRHGAPTAEWIPASYQMGEEDFDLVFQASANGIVRVDVWGYLRVYYRRVVDKETFTPYYYLFNNWNPHRNEYGVDYELYSTYTAALNRDDSDDSTPTCNDVKEAFANEPGSFPGKGFPYGCEFMEGDFGYMYKSTGSQVGFDGARALERDPESCSRVMNGTFACDTASAAKHGFLFPHGWRVYLESPQPLSERWHPPPDVQFVTLAPNAGVEGEGDLDVAGEVDQFTIRTRARVVEAGKVFALYRTAGTSGTPDPSDPFLVLQARTVDAKTVFELFVDTGVDGCEVTLVTNASWTEPESVDLAVTYDDGAAAVYVDGSLDAMGSMPAECVSPTTKPTQWRLGDAGSGMAGDVNFLTVWSRTALAPWRVRRAALADYSHVPPPDHHFNFDEPPGTTEVTNSIDNGRRSSASLDPGCEIVGVHDGSLAQLDTSLAVLDADVHVHVPWTSKLAKVFQGSFSMQMWVKPGGDVEEDVELNIFGNYDVSDPEFGDCECLCETETGNKTCSGEVGVPELCHINVTGDISGKGVPEDACSVHGPGVCDTYANYFLAANMSDLFPQCNGTNFTIKWSYNSTYTGAVWSDDEDSTGGGGGGRKLLSQNPGDTYEPQPAALQSAEIVPDRRVTGRFVKLTQHSGDSMVVAELQVFRENFGSTLSIDADLALNKKVTGTEPVGRYVRLESTAELHFREVVVFDPTDTSVNLALNKPATVDSYIENYVAGNVVDGSLGTFSHTAGGNSWLEIDLGDEMPIGGIYIANLCDGVMSDPHWCSDSWNSAWNMESWQYMNNRVVEGGLKVQILDGDKNVVTESASITESRRAYVVNFREGFTTPTDTNSWIGLDAQDNTWQQSSCVAQASDKWDSWDQSTSQFTVQTLFVPEPSFTGPAKTIYARFIRLYKSCSTMINLSELAVWHSASPSVNLATGKSVTCYPACTLSGGGALLVDGSTDTEVVHSCYEGDSGTRGDLAEGACASTVPKSIEIDLGQDYPIDGVLIVNRLDVWRLRSEGLMVDFRDSGNSVVLTTAPITQSHMDSAGFIMDLQAGIPPFAAEFDAWRYVPEGGISNSSDFDWKNTVWCQSGETWNGQGCSANSNPSTAPVPGSGSGSGGGTSTEYGDCECYCDGSYQGIIPVDDGVTESFCDNNGPGPSQCPNMGFTCEGGTTTVTWVYNSAYQGTNFDR